MKWKSLENNPSFKKYRLKTIGVGSVNLVPLFTVASLAKPQIVQAASLSSPCDITVALPQTGSKLKWPTLAAVFSLNTHITIKRG